MSRNQKDETFDYSGIMKDAGLVAASAAATVGGSAKVLDLGAQRLDARVIVDVTACEAASNDEGYTVIVQVSNSPTFASTKFVAAAALFGDPTITTESLDTAVPRRQEIAFTNEINGVVYRYARLYTVVVGTIATGINYSAFLTKAA
jgi:hypothetical protein